MPLYFDTHSHLAGAFYHGNLEQDIAAAKAAGVDRIVVPGTTVDDSQKALTLANQYPGHVYAAVGVHPSEAHSPSAWAFLEQIDYQKVVAIGETGLDLYHQKTNPPLAMQQKAFAYHIALASQYRKPLIVHARNAEQEVFDVLSKVKLTSLIMHCYTGSWELAQEFLKMGAYISIAGVITYTQDVNLLKLAKLAPLSQLIVETDAPFLTPVPHRGLTNQPLFVKEVAHFVAKLRPESETEVLNSLYSNAKRAFIL